jgi:hypothetical protein
MQGDENRRVLRGGKVIHQSGEDIFNIVSSVGPLLQDLTKMAFPCSFGLCYTHIRNNSYCRTR